MSTQSDDEGVEVMLKAMVRRAMGRAGYEVRRLNPKVNPTYQLVRSLLHFGVDLVLDVGANEGQAAQSLRAYGYQGRIVSFEPLESAHLRLSSAARRDPVWIVHDRCALGDRDGESIINVSANSVSSSVLPMLPLHETTQQAAKYVRTETVSMRRLDTVALPYLQGARRPFLKLDSQGYEKHVLAGAEAVLPRLCGVQCELSLEPLYAGQTLWDDLRSELEALGFALWSIQPGFTDPDSGRTLQIDATFFRSAGSAAR